MPYVDLDGAAAYYEQHGAGDPVVLLHGGFCSNETWQAQAAALATRFRVHALERPGQGRSADREGPITFEGMVADTMGYLDHAGIDRAHLVGFSDGAITALMLGMQHPERVRSLVSISANLHPSCFAEDGDGDTDGGAVVDGPESVEDDDDPDWVVVRAAYDRLSPDGAEHGDVVLQKLVSLWETQPDIAPSELTRIAAPTLVLAGDADTIPTAHTRLIAGSIPGARLCVVPDAGHMVITQRPDLVNQAVLDFLAEVDR